MINSDLYISLMKLNEICEVYSGYAIKEFNNIKKGLPVIKIGNILTDGTLNLGECQFSTEDINEKYHSKKGDIYVALSGATTGKLGIMEDEKKYIINQRVGIIRLKQKSVSQSYIKFFLLKQTERIIDEATGCAQPNISPKQIGEYDVPVFSEKEMLQISDILNNIVCVIKHYKAMIKKYDDLIKARFIEMFGRPFINNLNWESKQIKNVVNEVKYGTSKPSVENGEYKYLRMNNLTYDGRFDLTDLKFISLDNDELEKCVVRKGDVLFNRTNSLDLIGKTAEFDFNEDMVIAGYIIRIRLKETIVPKFFSMYMNTDEMKLHLRTIAKGAVNQANINAQELQEIPIYLPPIELQYQFVNFVRQVDKSREEVKKALEKTQQLYDSLMQEYFG